MRRAVALALLGCVLAAGCEREARRFDAVPPYQPREVARTAPHHAGPAASPPQAVAAPAPAPAFNPREDNAYAVAQGKRLFRWFNCNGCHGAGGGGMGPPLMDREWRYGHEPAQVVETILHGRPNGMPAFAGRISDEQALQLAAYVRSMSGLVRADVLPGRSDAISPGQPEVRRDPQRPPRAASGR